MAKLIKKVKSIGELRNLASTNEDYRNLAIKAAQNLGGELGQDPSKWLDRAISWLYTNAQETDEKGVVGEINFCRDLV